MARHHPDLIFCRKQPGVGNKIRKIRIYKYLAIGRLCDKCIN